MINRAFQLIKAQTYAIEKWLDSPGEERKKIRATGIPRSVIVSQLKVGGALVKHIEFLVEGLQTLAKPPASGCVECKIRQQQAAELLAGKDLG